MSRFYVGQRVRIVSCDDPEDLEAMSMIGREAVVDSLDVMNEEDVTGNVGVTIDGDDEWCFWPHELEPITDSYDKSTWDQCIWKPEHLRVGA